MPQLPIVLDDDEPTVRAGLEQIRVEMELPGAHPPAALAEAEQAARRVLGGLDASIGHGRVDARSVPFVTIDPPGSRDLDQALHLERRPGGGYRVRYAIADVGAFVEVGSALDAEVWARGVTYYLPDGRVPLHPAVLGEGAASLLPAEDRPALLWTIDLDEAGVAVTTHVERAVVRSRAQLTYGEVQAEVDAGRATGTLALLAEVGQARQAIEAERGGVSLDLPTQRVVRADGGYRLEYESVVPAMGWNAQISLLTGMEAATAMLAAGTGLLRTLPPPPDQVVRAVRSTARTLGVAWPDGAGYAEVLRGLDSAEPEEAALLAVAARGLRGAGYLALVPGVDVPAGEAVEHAAVAAPYAHVTAPLRRLADRFALECCVALFDGGVPPEPVTGALAELPRAMAVAAAREGRSARAAIDLVEVLVLAPRVGEVLEATVVAVDDEGSTVVVASPAIQAFVAGHALPLGETVRVRVDPPDTDGRRACLTPV